MRVRRKAKSGMKEWRRRSDVGRHACRRFLELGTLLGVVVQPPCVPCIIYL